ncbi:MAG TPA: flagellar hook capping FlgD N-terminal domain-containing protein [Parasulfuritortus sp.]
MTSTASLIAALNGTSASSSSASSSSAGGSASDIQSSFLKLLTTQLQNQDPTNPMDSAQMTSQLAQISTAQGLATLNTTVSSLLNNYQTSQSLQAVSLVGKNVLAEGDQVSLSSSQGYGAVDLAGAAKDVTVTIKDSSGATVRTIDLGAQSAGVSAFSWDGKDNTGNTVSDGTYYMSASATDNSGTAVTATPLSLSSVSSVSLNNGSPKVTVAGLGDLSLSQIYQVY